MTSSSVDPRVFEAAQSGFVPYALLKDSATQSGQSAADLLDELSYDVAFRYSANEIDFKVANAVMNALWAVCVSEEFWVDHDRAIPPATNAVYLAFDAGEYFREQDRPDTDPEIKYTRPLIDAFLAEYVPLRSRSSIDSRRS